MTTLHINFSGFQFLRFSNFQFSTFNLQFSTFNFQFSTFNFQFSTYKSPSHHRRTTEMQFLQIWNLLECNTA